MYLFELEIFILIRSEDRNGGSKRLNMKFCTNCGYDLTNMEMKSCPKCNNKTDARVTTVETQQQARCGEHPAPGRVFLHMTGIVYIVFGSVGTIWASLGLITADYWDSVTPIASGMPWSMYYAIMLVRSIFDVFIGIMGIVNRKRCAKATFLIILGCTDIGLSVLSAVASIIFVAIGIINALLTFTISSILAILFIIGANKNLKAYRNNQSQQ